LTIKSISDTEHSRSYLPISTLTALLPAANQSGRTYVCPSRIQFSKIEKTCWRSARPASSLFGDLVGGPGARPSQKKHVKILSGDNRDGMDRKDCQLLSRSYTDGFFTDSGHCLS